MKTNIKMRVTPEQYEDVQKIVFANGGRWPNITGRKEKTYTGSKFLFINNGILQHGCDAEFFSFQPEEEVDPNLFIRTNGTCEENKGKNMEELDFEKVKKLDFEQFKKPENDEKQKGHPHAKLMALYAQDAAETDRPWERWENRLAKDFDEWYNISGHPCWHEEVEYRRKPQRRTVLMGDGAVLPQPALEAKELDDMRTYFVVNLASDGGYADNHGRWEGGPSEYELLKRGLIHRTEEDAKEWADYFIKLATG